MSSFDYEEFGFWALGVLGGRRVGGGSATSVGCEFCRREYRRDSITDPFSHPGFAYRRQAVWVLTALTGFRWWAGGQCFGL